MGDKERVERFVADEDEQFRDEKEDMIKSESNSQWSEDDSPPILVASHQNSQNNGQKSQNQTSLSVLQNSQKSREIDAANKLEPLLKPLAHKPETEKPTIA